MIKNVFSVTIFLIAILVLYVIYNLYFVENIFIEKTSGEHYGFSIGMKKDVATSKLEEYLSEINENHGVEYVLAKDGKEDVDSLNSIQFSADGSSLPEFKDNNVWVIYICDGACDWRVGHHWLSFSFENEKLIRIAEYERRMWELP